VAGVPWVGVATGWAAQKSAALLLAVVSWFGGLPYAYLPAQEPAPLHSVLVQGTNFGGSFTMLGNHGLLIDCGNEATAGLKTVPSLFHAGYTPAALLVTSPLVSAGGGAAVVQRMWPGVPVIQAHELPPEGCVFETQAGRFTIMPAPAELSRRNAASHHPLVLWESPAGRVLYVGDAAYSAFSSLPEMAADAAILGQHPTQAIQGGDVQAGCTILLPGVNAESTGTRCIPVGENETLQLNVSGLKSSAP